MLDPTSYFGVLTTVASAGGRTSAEDIATLQSFHAKQLWHEFSSLLLTKLAEDEALRSVSFDLHEVLLVPIRSNLDGAVYVRLLFHACTAVLAAAEADAQDKVSRLIDSSIASLMTNGYTQCVYAVNCLKALVLMAHGPSLDAKALIDRVSDQILDIPVHELLPVLQAFLYRARLRQAELLGNYSDFYANAFAVARYGQAAGVPLLNNELTAVAYKAATAALLAADVYNFGDFLTNVEFVQALEGIDSARWALDALRMCSTGAVAEFDQFIVGCASALSSIPDLQLALSEGRLGSKVRLMALLHLVFTTPAHERVISFAAVAAKCAVAHDQVERLLLAALAQHLIEGSIDEVDQTIQVTWSLPRVLDLTEIAALADKIGAWRSVVKETAEHVGKLSNHLTN